MKKQLSLILSTIVMGAAFFTHNNVAFQTVKEKFGGIFQKGAPSKGLLDKLEKATQALKHDNPKLNDAVKTFNNSLTEIEIALRAAIEKHTPRLQDELNQIYAKGDALGELMQRWANDWKAGNAAAFKDLASTLSKGRDRLLVLLDSARNKVANTTGDAKNVGDYLITFGKVILSKYELMIKQLPFLDVGTMQKEELDPLIYFILTSDKDKLSLTKSPSDIFLPAKPHDQLAIKKAYQKLALQWHPDKLTPARKEEIRLKLKQRGYGIVDELNLQKLATAIFQYINNAYAPYK